MDNVSDARPCDIETTLVSIYGSGMMDLVGYTDYIEAVLCFEVN